MTASVAHVTRLSTRLGSPAAIARAAEEFRSRHCVRLPSLLDETILQRVRAALESATFHPRIHPAVAEHPIDLGVDDARVDAELMFLLNDPVLFDVVRRITGCEPIGLYLASVYRMVPGQGHVDDWHDDVEGNRMVAMSVNLGPEPYEGGVLEVRAKEDGRVLSSIRNTGQGDALLIRIDPALEHRVTEVTGTVPKTAFAGWFLRRPSYREWVSRAARA